MADQNNNAADDSTLTSAAKAVGTAIGKAANAVGVGGGDSAAPIAPAFQPKKRAPRPEPEKAPLAEDAYKAEYIGSGTFIIKKPKRNKTKLHQNRAKSPQRGARK